MLYKSGFTLVEALTALFVFAIVAATAQNLLRSQLHASEAITKKRTQQQAQRNAMEKMRQDFTHLLHRAVKTGENTYANPIDGQRDRILFTRSGWTNYRGDYRGELQRVKYSLRRNGQTTYDLIREYSNNLHSNIFHNRLANSNNFQREKPTLKTSQVLLKDVTKLSFFYVNTKQSIYREWPNKDKDKDKDERRLAAIQIHIESLSLGAFSLTINIVSPMLAAAGNTMVSPL